MQERYGYEQTSCDYRELLADPEIDVIDIVLPPFLHTKIAMEAMEAGKHVICEKPLFFKVEQGEEIKVLAEKMNKIVGVTYGFSVHHYDAPEPFL